jgi:hypothetical protein
MQKGGQAPSQGVDNRMCHVLRTRTELKHRDDLGEGIDGQPQPEDLCGSAQPGSQFVQLEVWEVQVAEAALMEELCVLACSSEPGGDGGLTVAEDTLCSGKVQSFGQRSEHHGDLVRGSFQTVQRGLEPRSERRVASLAAKGLDPFGLAKLAIADESVDGSVCNPAVVALLVRTGETLCVCVWGLPVGS